MNKPITFKHLTYVIAIGIGLFFGVQLSASLETYRTTSPAMADNVDRALQQERDAQNCLLDQACVKQSIKDGCPAGQWHDETYTDRRGKEQSAWWCGGSMPKN
jgi:hypothetical protein